VIVLRAMLQVALGGAGSANVSCLQQPANATSTVIYQDGYVLGTGTQHTPGASQIHKYYQGQLRL
jgi:hypothetical protein